MRFRCQATHLRLQSCSSGRHGLLLLLQLLMLLLSLLRLHLLRRLLRLLLRRRRQRHSCKAGVMSGHVAAGHAKDEARMRGANTPTALECLCVSLWGAGTAVRPAVALDQHLR